MSIIASLGWTPSSVADVHQRAADVLLVLRALARGGPQTSGQCGGGSVGPFAASRFGFSTDGRIASRNAASRSSATRSGTLRASVNMRWNSSAPSYSVVPAASENVRLNGFDITIE